MKSSLLICVLSSGALLLAACSDDTTMLSPETTMSDTDTEYLGAKPSCEVNPNQGSCKDNDNSGANDQKDVAGSGGIVFATYRYNVLTDNGNTLALEADRPSNGPTTMSLATNFSNTRDWLAGLNNDGGDGGATVKGGDIAAALGSGECGVNRGKSGIGDNDLLAELAQTFMAASTASFTPIGANVNYDKTADGAASDAHGFGATFPGTVASDGLGEGNISFGIGDSRKLLPGVEATATLSGNVIVYTGGRVLVSSRRGKVKDHYAIACKTDADDSATATVTDPAP